MRLKLSKVRSLRIRVLRPEKKRSVGQMILWKEFEDEKLFLKNYVQNFVKKLPNFFKKMNIEKPNQETLYEIFVNFKPSAEKLLQKETGHYRNLAIEKLISDSIETYPTGIVYKCGPNEYGWHGYGRKFHLCEIFIQIDRYGNKKLIYVDYLRSGLF